MGIVLISSLVIFIGLGDTGLLAKTLCFLMVLAFCSYRFGLIASIASSLVATLLYMYIYLMPNFEFHISSLAGLTSFVFLYSWKYF